ncbi:MAG: HAD-IC family P-type ATPase [Deltaproteobacteria bacterium]|nr:HAD-IC family P-type ATPase [Deltaproteobacteria bacterium]
MLRCHCHHAEAGDVLDLLGVDPVVGLDRFEIEHRREQFGPNVLSEKKERSAWVLFLLQFHQPLVYILLGAGLVTALLNEVVETGVILGVVLVNAIVGFLQEAKAVRAIQALARGLSSETTALRAGKRTRLPSAELVPGDVVLLQAGDRVPADLRLLQARELRVNESALTGEALPALKDPAPVAPDTPLGDRHNMAYSSTLVSSGTGTGVVVGTGDATEIGRISQMIASADVLQTPLTRKIRAFSHRLLLAILVLAGLTLAAGLWHGHSLGEVFLASVALAVGAIPEGLPAAVTIIMAIGVSRLARRRAIIRRLPAVETLGSTTVICSDKTGTLTQNQMTVQRLAAGGQRFEVSGVGYGSDGAITLGGAPAAPEPGSPLAEILRCGILCNDAELIEVDGRPAVQGDPTEGALLVAAVKGGLDLNELRRAAPRLDEIPFDSARQYMATLHDTGAARPRVAYLKGSLESLLPRCRAALGPAGEEDLEPDAVQAGARALAGEGLRVLALARKELGPKQRELPLRDVADGLVLLGLQGMLDPPRPEAAAAVAACQGAGVRVKMITGDHLATAVSIAGRIGIDGAESALDGRELAALSDDELIARAGDTAVFARVSPEHKLRLVEALQVRGDVVAMTGDGVNDAPALRRADIGVAMGLGGTEVAREAADLILTDDNFATIEAAVEEGRGVFDNLQKFIAWTLPTNGAEALVVLLAILLNLGLPILPVQILWINMMTAVCLGMMLAFEPKERGIMDRPPNPPGAPLLNATLLGRIVLVSVLLCAGVFAVYEWELARGMGEAAARTSAVAALVFGETFYLFNSRSLTRSFLSVGPFTNPWIWLGVGLMTAMQLLFTYLPPLNAVFGSAPLDAAAWLLVAGVSLALSLVVGGEKWLRSLRRSQ